VFGVLVASATTQTKTSEAIAAAYPSAPHPLVAEVPFSSARKWSAVALDGPSTGSGQCDGLRGIYALGAPELLRPYLSTGDVSHWPAIAAQAGAWAERGLRVLLVAHHPAPTLLEDRGDDSHLPDGMVPLGLVGLGDELRAEARETLAAFTAAGVAPKVISGDNPATVAALAQQAGFGAEARLVSGLELEQMSAAAFAQTARVRPDSRGSDDLRADHAAAERAAGRGTAHARPLRCADRRWRERRPLAQESQPWCRVALERPYALLTIVALAAWLSLVRLFWRRRLLERFLGVSEKQRRHAERSPQHSHRTTLQSGEFLRSQGGRG
jgi:hypothetical protein